MRLGYFSSVSTTRFFLVSLALTLLWMILMGNTIKPLHSKEIVAFELAKTPEAASVIFNDWTKRDLLARAQTSIYLDFVFLVLYCLSIGLGCLVLSNFTGNSFLIQTGSLLSKIVALAGLCDVIENLAMLKTLTGSITVMPVTIAYWLASIKFLIVIVSLVFVLCCLIFGVVKRIGIK